jgi:hypothetical protein
LRAYRVGSAEVVAPKDVSSTVYVGFYELESPEDAQGLEWRWSARTGTIWLKNPKRDTTLVLDVDHPAVVQADTQRVTVRSNDRVLDSFDLPQGHRETRRIPMGASDLGESAMSRVRIDVDKPFVPAKLSTSRDERELGVRVFAAYLE